MLSPRSSFLTLYGSGRSAHPIFELIRLSRSCSIARSLRASGPSTRLALNVHDQQSARTVDGTPASTAPQT